MGTVSYSSSQSRPKMFCFILLVSMAASCLGGHLHHDEVHEIPEYWHSVSPQLRPIMKEFHQTLVKQASKSTDVSICGVMKTVFTMVIHARQDLDCGAATAVSASSDTLANTDHQAIVEATRSCIGSEDLCLIKKLGSLRAQSPSLVCSALRDIESALQSVLDLVSCHEELELGSTQLGSSSCWGCASTIFSAAMACYSNPSVVECIKDALGAGSGCLDCICSFISC